MFHLRIRLIMFLRAFCITMLSVASYEFTECSYSRETRAQFPRIFQDYPCKLKLMTLPNVTYAILLV